MDDEIRRAEAARHGTPYLNTAQAAHYLGISERSLQRLRARGEGPLARRHMHMVQYHIDDLMAWSRASAEKPAPRASAEQMASRAKADRQDGAAGGNPMGVGQ